MNIIIIITIIIIAFLLLLLLFSCCCLVVVPGCVVFILIPVKFSDILKPSSQEYDVLLYTDGQATTIFVVSYAAVMAVNRWQMASFDYSFR